MQRTAVDPKRIAEDWNKKGFSCELWTDAPGQLWEDYVHDVDELVAVLDGRLRLEIQGKSRTLEPGDEAFIPARAVHTVENVGGATARWLYGYKRK